MQVRPGSRVCGGLCTASLEGSGDELLLPTIDGALLISRVHIR
jgi:hypothetical protein